jgi:hypothetical protein
VQYGQYDALNTKTGADAIKDCKGMSWSNKHKPGTMQPATFAEERPCDILV